MQSASKNYKHMDKSEIPIKELKYLMDATYKSLVNNKNRTLSFFIIYDEGDNIVEVENKTERLKVIDILIEYFEKFEEYEKCEELIKTKKLVIQYSN